MKKQLAFVLGGGGSRGALQVGALRALLESGIYPDLLVGTSIGAVNAAFLAVNGVHLGSVEALTKAWQDAQRADLLPSNYLWLTVRSLFKRPSANSWHRMKNFFIEHGLNPDLRFGDLQNTRLITVATDLNSGRTILYGMDPKDSVLEGVLASTALPPWVNPIENDSQLLMDGGAVSNLPIEPALAAGADEIIAFDLYDSQNGFLETPGFGSFLTRLLATVEQRQTELELALAAACSVPVWQIHLHGEHPTPLWDFHSVDALMTCGYTITRQEIASWQAKRKPGWQAWFDGVFHRER